MYKKTINPKKTIKRKIKDLTHMIRDGQPRPNPHD